MHKIALVFPGQGSQYVGMGKKICEEHTVAKATFNEANHVLGYDLKEICFNGRISEINKIENVFAGILTVCVAIFRVYMKEINISPAMCAGHSLGEYAALVCAGAIEFADALKIIHKRAQLAKDVISNTQGVMSIINGINPDEAVRECAIISDTHKKVMVSCFNSGKQISISGNYDAVLAAEKRFLQLGAQPTPLMGSAPLHSSLMACVAEDLRFELMKCQFAPLMWPIISNVYALPYKDEHEIADNLVLQLTKPVQWFATMQYIKNQDIYEVIEIGPQSVLTNIFRADFPKIKAYAFGQEDDRNDLHKDIWSESNVHNRKYESTLITRCLAVAVCTKNRNWDIEECINGIDAPYERIEQIQQKLEQEDAVPSKDDMLKALECLRLIFITKKTPMEEQIKRFNQLFDETDTHFLLDDFLLP